MDKNKSCEAGHVLIHFKDGLKCPLCVAICKHDKEHLKMTTTIEHLEGRIEKLNSDLMKCFGKDE